MHQPSGTGQMHSSQNPSIMYILGPCIAKNVVIWCASWYTHFLLLWVTLFCECLVTFVPVGRADWASCHSCDQRIDNCNQDWSNKPLWYRYSNQARASLITCSLLLWPLQVWFSPVVSVWSVPHTHSTTTTAFACIFQCFFCQQVQQSCNSSSASPDTSEEPCPTDMVKMTKSKTFQAYLPSCHRTYSCIHCRAHLANHDELISKVHTTPLLCCPPEGRVQL